MLMKSLFCLHILSLILAWIINYIHYKAWDEITHPSQNVNGAMDMQFNPTLYRLCDYLSMSGFKLIHVCMASNKPPK